MLKRAELLSILSTVLESIAEGCGQVGLMSQGMTYQGKIGEGCCQEQIGDRQEGKDSQSEMPSLFWVFAART